MKAQLFFLPLCLVATTLCAAEPQKAKSATPTNKAAVSEDIGDIEEAPSNPIKWRASIGAHADFTTNATLSGNHSSGDVIFFPTLQGGFNTELGKGFSFDFDLKADSALYSRYDERSFAGVSAAATLDWRPKPNLPRIFIGIEPYRYDSFDTGKLLTQSIGTSIGTDWGYAFNKGNSLAIIGYTFTKGFSDPTINNSSSNKLVFGVTHQIKPQLYGQLIYLFTYTEYDNIARNDVTHLISANLIYQFNKHLFGNLGGSFADNNSSDSRASYQSAGATIGLTWNFF